MSILETIKNRRSIRKFRPEPLPAEKVAKLQEALIWAPSAGNLQARRFFFVYNDELKAKLATAALKQQFVATAPLVIVACADRAIETRYGARGINLYAIQDVAASIMGMMLLAHAEGLGSCWVGAFHEDEVSRLLELPANLIPVALVPMGFPAKTPTPPPRVAVSEAIVEVR
ncbi:nitroreductase family protein [Desulfurivibrio alkaliphilus]|uniref:Nitroreductase n=1 Tax=Desulfurivibrio alkaliphilus (strain DSM 19089 / UNIQEM U267 / AHT2) TaxID=589865 RepID=D6Z180_DESAT|nr:nitroreductase family protein [Desulfurivibrio alkaliphilus]ADH85335.1 nitroreductase [Desulfurivibrio alkaliphilus AHT 2]